MKNYGIIALFVVIAGGQFVHAKENKRLVTAIKSVDLSECKKALVAATAPTNEEKNTYLGEVKQSINDCKKNATLWKGRWDSVKVGKGTLLRGVGVLAAFLGAYKYCLVNDDELYRDNLRGGTASAYWGSFIKNAAILGGLSLPVGCYVLYEGYQCALEKLGRARKIKKAIKLQKTVEELQKETV